MRRNAGERPTSNVLHEFCSKMIAFATLKHKAGLATNVLVHFISAYYGMMLLNISWQICYLTMATNRWVGVVEHKLEDYLN